MNIGDQLKRGIRSGLPIGVGYFPIAIAFGALANQAGLSWLEATSMSLFVYAGASQFAGVGMLLSGVGAAQIVTATFFLNLRHLIMSLAVNHQIRHFSQGWKNLLSFGITDETFAMLTLGEKESLQEKLSPGYMGGLLGTAYLSWVLGTAVGGLGASFIPEEITTAMIIGLYGLFIGLLVPPAKKSLNFAAVAVISMILNTLLSRFLDAGWAIILATIFAAGAGILINRRGLCE
jgi:4-azaleucine resistance transporter AzlC